MIWPVAYANIVVITTTMNNIITETIAVVKAIFDKSGLIKLTITAAAMIKNMTVKKIPS